MNASPVAYELIRSYESLSLEAYPDPESPTGDPWTIGWGTTVYPDGVKVRPSDHCTKEQADQWLIWHVEQRCEVPLNAALQVPVNQPMFDALVSWIYNVGERAVRRSKLIRLLNDGSYLQAQDEFDRWVMASGHISRGLVRRRDEEQALFSNGISETIAYAKSQGWLTDSEDA